MLLNSWLKNLTTRVERAPARPDRRRNTCRLMLETLESRLAPAIHTWTGGAASAKWSEPDNWDAFGPPSAATSDSITTVIFPDSDQTEMDIASVVLDRLQFDLGGNAIKLSKPLGLRGGVLATTIINDSGTNEIISTSATNPLVLQGSNATIQVDAGILIIKSAISEAVGAETDLIKNGAGILDLSAAGDGNTYTGLTFINAGTLRLNSNTNNAGLTAATQVGDGNAVGGLAVLELLKSEEIPDNGFVSVLADGRVIVRPGVKEDFTSLIVNGGRVSLEADAVLGIASQVFSDGSSGSAIDGAGELQLQGGTVTFNIADGPDASDLLKVAARITEFSPGTELRKIGRGKLLLSASGAGNTYTGATLIGAGALELSTNTTNAGLSPVIRVGDGTLEPAVLELRNSEEIPDTATVVVLTDGRLNVSSGITEHINTLTILEGRVNLAAHVEFGIKRVNANGGLIDGDGALELGDGTVTFDVGQTVVGPDLVVSTPITQIGNGIGNSGLTKTGLGTLELSAAGTGNTYAGQTQIEEGMLRLNTTTNAAGLSANVLIGDGRGLRGSAMLQLVNSNQLPDTAVLSVFADGRVNIEQDVNEEIRNLVMLGGQVNVDAAGNIQIGNGGQVFSAGAPGSVIDGDGELRLASQRVTFNIADVAVDTDLVVAARITEVAGTVGLIKTGLGTLELSAGGFGNRYTGLTTIADGTLRLNTNTANLGLSPFIQVGDGIGEADSAVLELLNSDEIPDDGGFIVLADGQVDFGQNETERLSFLAVQGGQVNLAANRVVQIEAGQVFSLESVGSVIDGPGSLQLDGTIVFDIEDGSGAIDLDVTANITGTAAVNKIGNGLLRLSGINAYTGPTTVLNGALQVDGSQPGSAVALLTGGTLGGGGTVGPITAEGGTLAPGLLTATVPVALKSGNLTLGAATFAPVISGRPGGAADQLVVTGTVNLTGATLAPVRTGIGAAAGQAFLVLDNDDADAIVGTFVGLPEGASLPINGQTFVVTYRGGDGNDVVLTRDATFDITVTPIGPQFTNEEGRTAQFRIVLNSIPSADVTIPISSSDPTAGTIAVNALTFTRTNARTPQIVTVTGINDAVLDGNIRYQILTAPAVSLDPVYNQLDAADVELVNLEFRPKGTHKFLDQDGDIVKLTLTGPGRVAFSLSDPDGDGKGPIEFLELAGTLPDPLKPKAILAITVVKSKTSTDGGTVGLGTIAGTGLKSISARKANLNLDGINLTGYLGALTIGNITNGADVTTLVTTNPKQKTSINALAIGDGTTIDVGAHMISLIATSFGAGSVKAPSVGAMIIKGDMAADVNITGVGVDPTKKALNSLTVKGAVTGSNMFVTGNVGNVVVGAFRDSRLFAGYTGADDGTGTFNLPATVTAFKAIGKTVGFQNSRVIANSYKTVMITNLDSTNPASKFGFYADANLGAINVVGPTKFKFNAALATPQGVGDFEVQIV